MAWWLQGEIDDECGKRLTYKIESIGDTDIRMKAAEAQVEADLMARYFTPHPGSRPWPMPASVHDPVGGTGVNSGFRQPMPDRPYQFRARKSDYLPDCMGFIITKRIRDVIEKLEPGVHQYLPCELYYKDGTLAPGERRYLNICNRLDTIAPEHCNIGIFPDNGKYYTGNGTWDVKVLQHKVAGHAIWSEWKYNNRTYVSDAFAEAIKALGVHGWVFRKYVAEV